MKYSIQLSDAIHIMCYIVIYKDTNMLSSEMIAQSVETNAANVRKIMVNLKKTGLIRTTTGKPKPYLAKDPKDISLLDIYKSIHGNANLIQVDPKTNPDCIVGANIQEVLDGAYNELQVTVEEKMAKISLFSLLTNIASLEESKRPENKSFLNPFLIKPKSPN